MHLLGRCSPEDGRDLLVGDLGEVVVPDADCPQVHGQLDAHEIIDFFRKLVSDVWCSHRYRQDDASRTLRLCDLNRGARGAAGGDAVVYDDDGPAAQTLGMRIAPEASDALFDLLALLLDDFRDLLRAEADAPAKLAVHERDAAFRDRAEPQLGLPWNAQFAHDEHVERRVERTGDLIADGDAPARKGQNDGRFASIFLQQCGQLATGLTAIFEGHAGTICSKRASAGSAPAPCPRAEFSSDARISYAFALVLTLQPEAGMRGTHLGHEHVVHVPIHTVVLAGNLDIPAGATGIVLFAHGSGSSRHSPRNRFVAHVLREAGMATLLIDLLTAEEEQRDLETAEYRFDIPLLADRLVGIIDWLAQNRQTSAMSVGLFGSSTGAAAALIAAAQRPGIAAVVSRGGRVDLAIEVFDDVRVPTLMLVGGLDEPVLRLNEKATRALAGSKLVIIPGATHLFEEPGALEEVARQAALWFWQHLAEAGTSARV